MSNDDIVILVIILVMMLVAVIVVMICLYDKHKKGGEGSFCRLSSDCVPDLVCFNDRCVQLSPAS